MKIAQIVHNPTAGDGGHSKKDLLEYVEGCGYEVEYVSTHEHGWKKFRKNQPDVIFLAGGDGTVHKLAEVLLRNKAEKQAPIYLLPMGTANNIARTLNVEDRNLEKPFKIGGEIQSFGHGNLTGIADFDFFLESVGIGIFPKLIGEMEKAPEITDTEEKLEYTLKILQKIVGDFRAENAEITIDENKITGSFLLVEVMNIKYIGPNLELAPEASPEDELLEVVLVPEENRQDMLKYLTNLIHGNTVQNDVHQFVKTIKGRKISLHYKGENVHVDDDLIHGHTGKTIHLQAAPDSLKFLTS